MKTTGKRYIAVYARKSKLTRTGESIAIQIDKCRSYIRSLPEYDSGTEIKVYQDEGYSGGTFDRPDFRRLLTDCMADRVSAPQYARGERSGTFAAGDDDRSTRWQCIKTAATGATWTWRRCCSTRFTTRPPRSSPGISPRPSSTSTPASATLTRPSSAWPRKN